MFEDIQKALKKIEKTKSISVPIETDESGYIDKQCPSEKCEFLFKVNEDDWSNIFKDETVWCPFCRHEAPAEEWFTVDQVEHAKKEALKILTGEIHNAMRTGAQKFNRGQPKGGLISMSFKVQGGPKRTYAIPALAAEAMQLEIVCDECKSRFAVIGSAYFCPACGHNSVSRTFSDSLRKIRSKIENVNLIKTTLTESVGKDEAELICRSLIETSVSDGVVAFQKYCEGLYEKYGTPTFNTFQRLKHGSELWVSAIGEGYSDWLTSDELSQLNILYQKRHLLSHNEGIVDEDYMNKSGDTSYKKNQRIVVSTNDIQTFLDYLEKLSKGLVAAMGENAYQNP